MFTGLIEDVGTLREFRQGSDSIQLTVETRLPEKELILGESIAVNGICLTVTSFGGGTFCADVSPETLKRTALGSLGAGSRVNLERALKLSDRLGGHLVSGHVDTVATVSRRLQERNAILFSFTLPTRYTRYLVEKGSVAIDGISLTVNSVEEAVFWVSIIPHTLSKTTLENLRVGSTVNIETDVIGKYIERLMKGSAATEPQSEQTSLSLDYLAKHGFL